EVARAEHEGIGDLEEPRDRLLEIAVDLARAGDHAGRPDAEAVVVERELRRGDQARVVGQAEVVLAGEVDDVSGVNGLRAIQPGLLELLGLGGEHRHVRPGHRASSMAPSLATNHTIAATQYCHDRSRVPATSLQNPSMPAASAAGSAR